MMRIILSVVNPLVERYFTIVVSIYMISYLKSTIASLFSFITIEYCVKKHLGIVATNLIIDYQ